MQVFIDQRKPVSRELVKKGRTLLYYPGDMKMMKMMEI